VCYSTQHRMSNKERKSRIAVRPAGPITLTGRAVHGTEFPGETQNEDFVKTLRTNSARSKGETPRRVSSKSPRGPIPSARSNNAGDDSMQPTLNRILSVKLLSCRVVSTQTIDQGCYVSLAIGNQRENSRRIDNDENPKFDEEFSFTWDGVSGLSCRIFDCAAGKPQGAIGSVDITLAKTDFSSGGVLFIDNEPLNGGLKGNISLEITETPFQPTLFDADSLITKDDALPAPQMYLPQEITSPTTLTCSAPFDNIRSTADSLYSGTRAKSDSFDKRTQPTQITKSVSTDILEAVVDKMTKVAVEFSIDWDFNERNLRMDILRGIKLFRDELYQKTKRAQLIEEKLHILRSEYATLERDTEENVSILK